MQATIIKLILELWRKTIQGLLFLFSSLRRRFSSDDPLEMHFVLLPQIFDEPVQSALNDHIRQWWWLVQQVSITRSKEGIPDGYIGIEEMFRGEKLISRLYLKPQVEYVARTIISSEKIEQIYLRLS